MLFMWRRAWEKFAFILKCSVPYHLQWIYNGYRYQRSVVEVCAYNVQEKIPIFIPMSLLPSFSPVHCAEPSSASTLLQVPFCLKMTHLFFFSDFCLCFGPNWYSSLVDFSLRDITPLCVYVFACMCVCVCVCAHVCMHVCVASDISKAVAWFLHYLENRLISFKAVPCLCVCVCVCVRVHMLRVQKAVVWFFALFGEQADLVQGCSVLLKWTH